MASESGQKVIGEEGLGSYGPFYWSQCVRPVSRTGRSHVVILLVLVGRMGWMDMGLRQWVMLPRPVGHIGELCVRQQVVLPVAVGLTGELGVSR